jgi:hypothetical protein
MNEEITDEIIMMIDDQLEHYSFHTSPELRQIIGELLAAKYEKDQKDK